jgi:hypothetical protein
MWQEMKEWRPKTAAKKRKKQRLQKDLLFAHPPSLPMHKPQSNFIRYPFRRVRDPQSGTEGKKVRMPVTGKKAMTSGQAL